MADVVSFDVETHLVQPGLIAPPLVCAAVASASGARLLGPDEARRVFLEILRGSDVLANAALAFDVCVMAADAERRGEDIMPLVVAKYDRGEVHDPLISCALEAIALGNFTDKRGNLLHPRTGAPLLKSDGSQAFRYSLELATDLVLGRPDAKKHDYWRERYAVLERVPMAEWPPEARQYPVDDVVNARDGSLAQRAAYPWYDGASRQALNLAGVPRECRADLGLRLGATWGFRTDAPWLERIRTRVEEQARLFREAHADLFEWDHAPGCAKKGSCVTSCRYGKERGADVRRRVAEAYGARGACSSCAGERRRRNRKGNSTVWCGPKSFPDEVTCDGTGLDLSTAPALPRTDGGGVKTDRDTLKESGDEQLMAFGDDEFEKVRTTYLPKLRAGVDAPFTLSPNVLVTSFRTSYDGIIQLIPQGGDLRPAFRARPGWYFGSCVEADARLLHADMTWRRAGDVKVGDHLVGFDDDFETEVRTDRNGRQYKARAGGNGRGRRAKFRESVVERVDLQVRPCFRVVTDRGSIVATDDHRWVGRPRSVWTGSHREWLTTRDLKPGDDIAYFCDPWTEDPSREAGYLAGVFDGEGWVAKNAVHFGQNPGAVLDRVRALLASKGFDYGDTASSKNTRVRRLTIRGGEPENMRFLGAIRPERLVTNYREKYLWGRSTWSRHSRPAKVLRVDRVEPHEVAVIQTSTGTYVAEGFLSHNCDYSGIELCTLAQVYTWLFGFSPMAEVINATGDPGALHDEFGARDILGIPLEEFKRRKKAKEQFITDVRNLAKRCNFGLGGGMGVWRFVLTCRREATTMTGPDGTRYKGIRPCLVFGAERCGVVKVTEWRNRTGPPTCLACLEASLPVREAWIKRWQMQRYFDFMSANADGPGVVLLGPLGRAFPGCLRGGVGYTDGANGHFQGLAAILAKVALWRVVREMYADRSSVLFGTTRMPFFVHDDDFLETRAEVAHLTAPRVALIMTDTAASGDPVLGVPPLLPDVVTRVEPALSRRWIKAMEPAYDASGKLIPWEDSPEGRLYLEKMGWTDLLAA